MSDLNGELKPTLEKSGRDGDEPEQVIPNTDREKSRQMGPRKDTLLPTPNQSKAKVEDSSRVRPKTEGVGPKQARL